MNDLLLGIRTSSGVEAPFFLSEEDRRQHVYVIGTSGVGKSALLVNMAVQDIVAGRGCAFLDPHGDDALRLLNYIPRWRFDDVVFFDPSDTAYPIGFNLLEKVPVEKRHLVASGIVSVFRNIWPDFWGPRLEYILHAAIAALLDCEGVSLLGIPRMLSDERYRAWVVKQVKDPFVRAVWVNEIGRYDKRFFQEAIAPIQNKVGQLFMAPPLRNILGQVISKMDARFMMDNRRIFIANLSKGKIGEDNTNLLGSLLVTQFQLAAMSRADVPEYARPDFGLYVDEFQSFVSNSFASVLSEARKYRLSLTLAHQYLDQLKPEILNAVLGNVGSMIAFRIGANDVETIERAFGRSYSTGLLTTLGNGEVCAKLLCQGQQYEPFLGRTFPVRGKMHGWSEKIVRLTRQKYGTPRHVIEKKVEALLKIPE